MASKVITLFDDDPIVVQTSFQQLLTEPKLLFIVFDDSAIARDTVRKADKLSGGNPDEPQWVVHIPKRNDVLEILQSLSDPLGLVTDWNDPLAIVLSMADVICDSIIRNGTTPTYARIDDAYRSAEIG